MITLHHGDCREVMATMPAESVDAIVTDPPYGLSFMGKDWDSFKEGDIAMRRNPQMDAVNTGASRQGGRQRACADYQKRQARDMMAFQEAMNAVFLEALRVAKPGSHLLAFGGTRTFHRLAVAIEDAGWEIRDTIMWVCGSGFPKSLDVGKALDKAAGAVRKVVGVSSTTCPDFPNPCQGHPSANGSLGGGVMRHSLPTAPATDAACQWDGWGTALKPAWEPVLVARKPCVGTVAENVLRYGTGGINVDGCRVGTDDDVRNHGRKPTVNGYDPRMSGAQAAEKRPGQELGRWPANVIHDGSDEVVGLFPQAGGGKFTIGGPPRKATAHLQQISEQPRTDAIMNYGDTGSAARFFYCAKASKDDRDDGCEGLEEREKGVPDGTKTDNTLKGPGNALHPDRNAKTHNHHPTVKPTELMRYLCRLVTPPGGVVLDPFCGSGSTGRGAVLEGMSFIGIDLDAEYIEISRRRINACVTPMERMISSEAESS